jgi:hypothetical protein
MSSFIKRKTYRHPIILGGNRFECGNWLPFLRYKIRPYSFVPHSFEPASVRTGQPLEGPWFTFIVFRFPILNIARKTLKFNVNV